MPPEIKIWSPPTTSPIRQSYLPQNFAAAQNPPEVEIPDDFVDENDFSTVAYATGLGWIDNTP